MTAEELKLLSDPSDDSVDGAEDFATGVHEKGMQKGSLPDDLDEDVNSGYQPSSEGLMVKESAKRSSSPTSAKDQGQEQAAVKRRSKKSKCKTSTEKGTIADKEAAEGAGDDAGPSKKKKKRLPKTRASEGHADGKEKEAQVAEGAAAKDIADQTQSAQHAKPTGGAERIDLSASVDKPPPKKSMPFTPIPRVIGSHVIIKDNDRGIGHPQIATALMDAVILPADVEEYTKYNERILMNRLSELTYKANIVRAAAAKKQTFVDNRLLVREQRIKTLEDIGKKASEMMKTQIKNIEALKAANQKLHDETADLGDMAIAAEDAKLKMLQEKAALEAEKTKVEATLAELRQEFALEKVVLLKDKADVETALEASRANQNRAEEASKKNYARVWNGRSMLTVVATS